MNCRHYDFQSYALPTELPRHGEGESRSEEAENHTAGEIRIARRVTINRHLVSRALRRGLRRRCPHCGLGPLFTGWAHHIERCPACGLVYERNPGDTWAFTILGDRLPVAAIIVLYLLQHKIRQLDLTWIRRRPAASGAAFGVVAGLFSGAVNVSAPPLVIYFMMLELPPLALTQMLNLCFIAGKTIQAATLSLAGPGSLPLLAASLPLTVLAIAALLLGIRLQKRMSPDVYSKILRAMLAAFVVLLTGQAAIELAHRLHITY